MSSIMGSKGDDSGFEQKLLEEERSQARLEEKKRKPATLLFGELGPPHSKTLKTVRKAFEQNNIQELENQISVWGISKAQIENFFRGDNNENAISLYHQALLDTQNDEALLFLEKHMPKQLLIETIRSENFLALDTLLYTKSRMEKEGDSNESDIQNLREKFKFLLRVDPEKVSQFILKPEIWDDILSDGVRDAFNQVKASKESAVEASSGRVPKARRAGEEAARIALGEMVLSKPSHKGSKEQMEQTSEETVDTPKKKGRKRKHSKSSGRLGSSK